MASSWITLDRLGTKGSEPDMMPPHREPASLDAAVNVRALGSNLANAGGFRLVKNGSLPQETPSSSCSCPDQHYQFTEGDGDVGIDRSLTWDWTLPGLNRYNAVLAFQVASVTGAEVDQTLIYRKGECENFRQNRVEIRMLNTSSARRIQVETYDDAGVSGGLSLDYDATTEFTDGNDHWLFLNHQGDGSPYHWDIYLDGNNLGNHQWNPQYSADYIAVTRANSPSNLLLPIAIWTYGSSIWSCLTGGDYNGLGRCTPTGAQKPVLFDVARSSSDLAFYQGNAVAVSKLGNPQNRNAYMSTLPVGGKVYWEMEAGSLSSPICRNTQYLGGCSRALDLGTQILGQVDQSFCLATDGNIWVDGVIVAGTGSPFISWARACFAFDPVAKQVWIGAEQSGSRTFMPGDPETVPGYACNVVDMIPAAHFVVDNAAVRLINAGTRFPAPAGFSEILPA